VGPAFGLIGFWLCGFCPPPNLGGSTEADFWRLSSMVELLWVVVLVAVLLLAGFKVVPVKRVTVY
jgi:hypothetical protein